ncbi:MAG: DNA-directed RNA polymerase subunit beta' [Ruminococcaceae bacterium]|nr:DNA-directed RNA polymerase subunit beta' [Oscillospiraceae bacterium]
MEKNIFDSIKIGLASPELIRSWSYGEVTKPETINYRTTKAERDGLFCERIFGPTKDWECLCGKYKRVRYKGKVCEKCGVEVTTKKVRRERMGHIELAAPVSHIWYFKAIPSRMGLLLDVSPKQLEQVLYFGSYIVLDPGSTPLEKKQTLTDNEYKKYYELYENDFRVGMGAEAVRELLAEIDIPALFEQLKSELGKASGQKKSKIIKRLEIVEAFRRSGNKPEWMVLEVLPVIPPEIRPMVQLDGGRYAASDLNDLYRRVINRNNRLKKLLELHAPLIIIRNEKRMLQEAVDALIDNGRRGKPVTGGSSNRPLKSLSEILRGKQGRFRQNLLGKRVDYSGRSVIVVGPELKIYQCGLPKEMALELFKPFVMKRLVETQKATNIKDAKKKVEKVSIEVWDALENVIKEHPVLLNRAPTLHRLSIQAFEPILVEGRAIKLHPLVCTAFNADFDGDQMPVHVPLSAEAQAEARFLMLSANNLLKPADGRAVAVPSQDMVLGSYYLTIDKAGEPGEGHAFRDFNEAMMAYENGVLGLHAPIRIRVTKTVDGVEHTGMIDATLGRLIFNQQIPQDLGFVDRSDPSKLLDLEIMFTCGKKQLGEIIDRTIRRHGAAQTAEVLDAIKSMGYKYSTKASISISAADVVIPPEKYDLIAKAEKDVDIIHQYYQMGELTEEERYNNVIKIWEQTTKDVVAALQAGFDRYNPIKMMSDSGARGNITQMRQLAGMRGLMFAANGRTMEIPIKANFREGLNILEYFIAARGSRKSLSDTALRTADSGYLTRRLVDVSQDVIIREKDCGTDEGILVSAIREGKEVIEPLKARLVGRFTKGDVVNPATGEVIVPDNVMIDEDSASKIIAAGIEEVNIRSILKCRAKRGICAHCYGSDMSSGRPVSVGEAVGIIAAQSIGEPGTQLTMRTFHSGGVAGSDITQGLPRVEEVFEARRPKKTAIMTEHSGRISISTDKHTKTVTVEGEEKKVSQYPIPYNYNLIVQDGDWVAQGAPLTEGYMSPQDIIKINGLDAVYDYIIREVQKVYRIQSVEINDKHIEVIARQMTRKCRIEEQGDTELLSGATVHVNEFITENEKIKARIDAGECDIRPATMQPILLGITKAALMTESFLSAASFQETTKVLTEAAIGGKVDNLQGLKENVIIGKLIPAGTGLDRYRNIEIRNKDGSDPNAKLAESLEAAAAEDLARQKAAFAENDDSDANAADDTILEDEE